MAVKLEGGAPIIATIERLVSLGIPVVGHLGLTPQSVHRMGGFKRQATTVEAGRQLLEDAAAIERAGAFAVVLECIPAAIASEITAALKIPTIGIGAGPHCDGQVLVTHDMLGLTTGHVPKFVRQYADLRDVIWDAAKRYRSDVESGAFPAAEHQIK